MVLQAPRHQRDAVLASEIARLDPFQTAPDEALSSSARGADLHMYGEQTVNRPHDFDKAPELWDHDYFSVWSFELDGEFAQPLPGRAY